MATLRTVLNRVLRTVGESEVASSVGTLTDEYHILVAEFVNQFKEEIEDAHQWRSLRQVLNATVLAGTGAGTITGANERSRVVTEQDARFGRVVPLVFDVTDPANPIPLQDMDLAELLYRTEEGDNNAQSPQYFAVDAEEADVLKVRIFPVPGGERTIKLTLIVPQDYLGVNDLDTNIRIPQRPLLQGSIWFALQERGEELGQSSMFTEERYRVALDDAVSRDAAAQGDYELVPV